MRNGRPLPKRYIIETTYFFKSQKFYSLFASVFNAGIALVTFSLLARALSKEDFGNWAFFLAIYGFIEMAMNGLVRTPVIRMAANTEDYNYEEVLSSAWGILVRISLILSAIAISGSLLLYFLTDKEVLYFQFAYWLPLYIIVSVPSLIGIWNCNALIKFQRILVIRATTVVVFLAGILLLYYNGGSLEQVYWRYLIATAAASLLTLLMGWTSVKFFFKRPATYMKEIINFGKYSMGTTLGANGLNSSDVFIIRYFLGAEALAFYEVPKRILRLYDIPLRSILQISYPHFAKSFGKLSADKFRHEFNKISGFTFFMMLPVAILIFAFAEPIVELLGGAEYTGSASILRVFSVYMALTP
ncbi:MAG: oligosaccharide flippase family protein [Owenweeksia sp.]|nr:oligosaccharide flippase family protein [Owenweeksia sp.]